MKIPPTLEPNKYTLNDLARWFEEKRSDIHANKIQMTLQQEMWYRNLLPPKYMTLKIVMFRGLPIEIE